MSMIHNITAQAPRYKRPTRKGRGKAAGKGKTAGRGNKGAKARVGKYVKRGHEHGQTPLFRRLPTRGFSNDRFERDWYVVNLRDLEQFADGATVDAAALIAAGLVPDTKLPVKILGDGQITRKLTVQVGWYSKSAHEKITAAGGAAQNAKGEAFAFPKPTPNFKAIAAAKAASAKKEKDAAGAAEGGEKGEKKKKGKAPAAGEAPAAEPKPSEENKA